jgi:methionine-rich copper-binding protein CopC
MERLTLAIGISIALTSAAFAQSSMPNMPGMDHGQMGAGTQMLSASDPADGATLARAPRTLSLTFMHPVMLQTVSVVGPNNAAVAATFRRPSAPTAAYGIALPPSLSSGAYTVTWNASGMGHAMQGVLHFTVQ